MTTFKKGAKGSPIKKLQEQLNKNGAKPKLNISGVFDDKMLDAVKTFQKKSKLKVDGILGPNTQASLDAKGKAPKWPLKDVKRPIEQLKGKLHDATKAWMELAVVMGDNMKNKDVKFAYRNFKIAVETYKEFLHNFIAELQRVEDLQFEFNLKLKGKPHEQAVAIDEAQRAYNKAMKMNKIAEKLKRRFDTEHDKFLEALDGAPA